jgi:hypothetical protein
MKSCKTCSEDMKKDPVNRKIQDYAILNKDFNYLKRFTKNSERNISSENFAADFDRVDHHSQISLISELQRTHGNQFVQRMLSTQTVPQPGNPEKALDLSEEKDEEKPSPMKEATIKCNGSGGYRIVYGSWAGATCGTKSCVRKHEKSHIKDWKAKWPDGCKGQSKGYLPKGDPPDKPLMTANQYKAFLKKSECEAHKADLKCAKALLQKKGCKKTIKDYIKLTKKQKKKWC